MPETLPALFFETAARFADREALGYKKDGNFNHWISWKGWASSVREIALGLHDLGLQRGDTVGILAENSPFWVMADLAVLSIGAADVPLYPTLSQEDLAFIISNSGMKAIFVSNAQQYEKVKTLNPAGVKVFSFCDVSGAVESLDSLRVRGRAAEVREAGCFKRLLDSIQSDDLATLIYTSGTTGTPKGVMLTHSNFIQNYKSAAQRIFITPADTALSFLPLSHVFERLAGFYFMAFSGARIVYAESMQTVADDIKKVRPTVAAAVPRFYEKVYAALQAKLQSGSAFKRAIFSKAVEMRKKVRSGGSFVLKLLDFFYDILVFSKIRAAVGGRLRFFISGGAPLSRDLAEFFNLCGILILEGYGLTETSPVIAVNTEKETRFGTVGKVIPGVQVKIAADGEILTAGPCVMKGYYRNPEATAEALQGGWFHTGDIGEIDQEGYLKITDRKKDLIVTAGGKKVAPQKLEGLILRDPLFSQVITLGDKKPYVVALVVLNKAPAGEGASLQGIQDKPFESWGEHPGFHEWVGARLYKQLEGVARYEAVKNFAILPQEFSIQNGELTPTLKIKRRFVMEKHKTLIEKLYQSGPAHEA